MIKQIKALLSLSLLPLLSTASQAGVTSISAGKGSPAAMIETGDKTLGEKLDNLGRIHLDEADPFCNEFWLLGRYHGQYHWTDTSNGSNEGYESRRVRAGFQGRFFHNLTLHAQAISGSDFEPTYNGFTELWASWKFSDAFNLTVGQQKQRFTHDRNISSRYINYLERTLVTNMFAVDYTPAVTVTGKSGNLQYNVGLFSNATGTNMADAFTELNSGWSVIAAFIYDLGKSLNTDTAHLYLSGYHSDSNENATNTNVFDNGLAAALMVTKGSWSLQSEITAGLGSENGDIVGLNLSPGVYLTDKAQLVARYQLAVGENENSLNSQRRYERPAGLGKGDLYQAVSLGLNYEVAKHRIKFISGVEYARMNADDALTGYLGFRVFWGPHSKAPFPGAQSLPGLF